MIILCLKQTTTTIQYGYDNDDDIIYKYWRTNGTSLKYQIKHYYYNCTFINILLL